MYLLVIDNKVVEVIPDIDPAFPNTPISARFAPDFVARLTHVPDDIAVKPNWIYDPDTGDYAAVAARKESGTP